MTRLMKYEPYNPFASIERAIHRMRATSRRNLWPFAADTDPSMDANPLQIDMVSDAGDIVVRTALPGVKEDEVQVDIQGNVLTISAETPSTREARDWNWYIHEIRSGKFSRSILLPENVELDRGEARLEDGILTVTLPKEKPWLVRNIIVKARKLLGGSKS